MIEILPLLIGISIFVGIIVIAIRIWKNKNVSILRKAALTITLAIGLLIAIYGLFAFILVSSDQASYFTQGSNLGKINYEIYISRIFF